MSVHNYSGSVIALLCLSLGFCMCLGEIYDSGCVSLVDSNLHFPALASSVSVTEVRLSLEDVNSIVSRELGVEDFDFGDKRNSVLPTGDVFFRPKAVMVFYIENLSRESIEKVGEEKLPGLFGLFVNSKHVFALDNAGAGEGVSMPALYSLGERFGEAVVRVARSEGSGEKAFEEFHRILSGVEPELIRDGSPDLYVFTLSLPQEGASGEGKRDLQALEVELQGLMQRFDELYGGRGRAGKSLVLLGEGKGNGNVSGRGRGRGRGRRVLQSNANTQEQPGFEGAEHILMVWTCVVLLLGLFLLFCCINWTAEMDPILTSGFKSEEHGKMS